MKPLLLALQFLTRLPLPNVHSDDPRDFGRSMPWYPLVGLIIGLLLAVLQMVLGGQHAMLAAALILLAWVLITGALHLDGLADSADAWIGGHGDRERTLAIMKDPYCGPAAVVVLVGVLLTKFAALYELTLQANATALILAPALARAALPALFLTTPYVRQQGLGSDLASHLPRRAAVVSIGLAAVTAILVGGYTGAASLVATLLVFLLLRQLMRQRLGGCTGDTAGAMVECLELTWLAGSALTLF